MWKLITENDMVIPAVIDNPTNRMLIDSSLIVVVFLVKKVLTLIFHYILWSRVAMSHDAA